MCIFNELLAAGLFPCSFGRGTSMHTDPSISGRKYRKSVYNAVFIHNKSLNVVSAAATSVFQLKHAPRLLGSICPVGYQIQTIECGKICVMLLYGKYYWCVYEVYNILTYTPEFQVGQDFHYLRCLPVLHLDQETPADLDHPVHATTM